MKKLILVSALFIGGCVTQKAATPTEDVKYLGYVSINPISLPNSIFSSKISTEAGVSNDEAKKKLASGGYAAELDFLVNSAARISIREVSGKGEVKYLTATVSSENKTYNATIDYIKYYNASVPIDVSYVNTLGDSKQAQIILGLAVGVGLRAEANFYSASRGAAISDIVNIGISAQNSDISGTMSFQTMGVESKAISDSVPIPAQLSAPAIQGALQAMSSMKANIYATETRVSPQIVGFEVQSYPDGVEINDILNAIQMHKKRIIDSVSNELRQRVVYTLRPVEV
ncbi:MULTISPECIES: hypothetical protein [unclassified Pseudomonas]|uniref:hypothetical protein n=1 Tax=unclassified Pseudomonas TaxID=196821 RepID=UPI00129D9480|nr:MULTISPECIES: hypothetical protein [unclassified Pseudomonas]MDH4651394.1 hypothetical protein [Pseudomonas sp. BN606]MRK23279.1 hypothetical protein [Pseudomonas sp. JG-B]